MSVLRSTPVATRSATGGKTYLAGLDGIRALAVGGVLLYHGGLSTFQGGFLGVDVFFVLSGFLITGLLAREIEQSGRLAIGAFYLRRFRRLVPALILLLAGTLVLSAFFVPDAAPRVRGDSLAALFYVSNWWLIVSGQSYFEFISRPPLLQHLWSLAIEEQFYLLWPLAVWTIVRYAGRRGLAACALGAAGASTWWMARLSAASGYPDVDPSRIYFGTDTHCMGLLLGAALAAVWQPWTAGPLTRRANAGLTLLGAVACAGIAYAYVQVGERAPQLYSGGFLLLSFLVCQLIIAAGHPASWFGHLLGRQPLRWIGERSYGLYLWHWPIYLVTRPSLDIPVTGASNLLLRLALTCAVAELSYRLVEHPIREGAIGRFVHAWRQSGGAGRRPLAWRAALVGIPATAMMALVIVALVMTPAPIAGGTIAPDVAEAMGIANGGPTRVTIERFAARAPGSSSEPGPRSVSTVGSPESPAPTATSGSVRLVQVDSGGLTAIGDSVLLGTRFQLQRWILGIELDAEVGRLPFGVFDRVHELQAENLLAPTVLMHLGTNGFVPERSLRRSLAALSDRRLVILVNAHAPRDWVGASNELLARVVRDYPNVVLIDWAGESLAHPEFFASDDIHLSALGQRAFTDAVQRAGKFPAVPPPAPKTARPPATQPETVAADPIVPAEDTVAEPAVVPEEAPPVPVPVPDSVVPDPLSPAADPAPVTLGIVRSTLTNEGTGDAAPTLVRHPKPMPLNRFWDAVARCETGGNWKNPGRYAGGLGIYVQTWEGWGGRDFAPTPDEAAPHEQIEVANRISTQGWTRPDQKYIRPVGFAGWGCVRKVVGMPDLLTFEPGSVVTQPFTWQQRGELVRDLQAILGLPRDGVYGRQTWATHVRHLEAQQLPRHLAPLNPPESAVAMLTVGVAGSVR